MSAKASLWTGRMVEWGILAILILVLLGAFGRQVRVVRGQGELAAVQTTLGALRTAFVLDYIQHTLAAGKQTVAVPQRNPFLLLESVPVNYAGERAVLQAEAVVPGSWLFDPVCSCIGYVLIYPEWLESPPDLPALWFSVAGNAGPLVINPLNRYVFKGQLVQ